MTYAHITRLPGLGPAEMWDAIAYAYVRDSATTIQLQDADGIVALGV